MAIENALESFTDALMEHIENEQLKDDGASGDGTSERFPVLALRGMVLFPNVMLHFEVGREKSILALNRSMNRTRKIFLVAQRDIRVDDPDQSQLYEVGVVAEIQQVVRTQSDTLRVLVKGLYRAKLLKIKRSIPYAIGVVEPFPVKNRISNKARAEALVRTMKTLFEEYIAIASPMPKEIIANIFASEDPHYLSDYIPANVQLRFEDKQKILEESSVLRRLELIVRLLEDELEILSLEQEIQEKVHQEMDKSQREYYLREQIRIISNELGEGENILEETEEYREKIEALTLSDEVREKLLKEVVRMSRMPSNSHETAVIRGWLDACLELPWNIYTEDKIDIKKARAYLEKEHYGLKKVKERVLEVLAVRKLSPDISGQIICLVGPPGVGKTSIARSIAASMGRNYARMSLGGVRDESDIRGHRKTYIGSMPGRIITAVKQAKSANPLILLDEIDKLGSDYKGDPSAALLEVLDAKQNTAFQDHFIEVPFDLSKVFFIATANDRSAIPAPLLDRMEIIELPSYTREEKKQIARRHLLPKQLEQHGLKKEQLRVTDGAIYELIDGYTREAGVRNLERELAAVCRKAAVRIVSGEVQETISVTAANLEDIIGPRKIHDEGIPKEDQVGVVNGLAWTSVGGEMLQVEAAVLDGSGRNQFTGSLGDVMKESVNAAITYIRSIAPRYNISPTFYKDKDIHIHFPEGAVPKDGPSAGITTCMALVSALSGVPVRHDVAMTGEITLRGRVLAIGGLREKAMAAYKNNIKTVVIPYANLVDLEEVDEVVKKTISFVPAKTMEDVFRVAFTVIPADSPDEQVRASSETAALPEKTVAPECYGKHSSTAFRQ